MEGREGDGVRPIIEDGDRVRPIVEEEDRVRPIVERVDGVRPIVEEADRVLLELQYWLVRTGRGSVSPPSL